MMIKDTKTKEWVNTEPKKSEVDIQSKYDTVISALRASVEDGTITQKSYKKITGENYKD